jgi:hypothetical protein
MAPTGCKGRRWEHFCSQHRPSEANNAWASYPVNDCDLAVAAMWIVGLTAYYFGFSSDLVWLVLFLGSGAALAEWRASQNRADE